ncbi:tetratricopeptide repeat protein [Streptomyces sp. NPDC005438]|uniref:serine/threonine-protein kinase n=1 Tax=Streptomyces sp. NPDC005438 TaxID=3156880 RepID=UPI00339E98EF
MSDVANRMAGQSCQRPTCTGAYEDMGGGEMYCDTCGLAPVVSADGMVGSMPTGITSRRMAAAPQEESSSRSSSASRSSSPSRSARSARSSRSSRSSQTSSRSVSGRLTGPSSARSVSVRSSRTTTSSTPRSRLGAGLVTVPDVPRADPATVVLADPEVPERKRYCGNSDCQAQVGRARGSRPGRSEGFCTKCGHPYSFVPKLNPGDLVHGQYEVAGCLAHGGLGWIYLAVDRAVADRWVVLKGLLDTGDKDAVEAAVSERRFLAEIEHSNIVRIYNFVEHLDQRTGSLDGYIVMEYVGGRSLKQIANSRRTPDGRRDPLPVDQACAYGIEALEALAHLHSRNLLYCDFKVDNAIQQHDQLKLIDMGAVRRMDDHESAIYGTVGYQAPEVPELGPSVASDLYTVARTLAVLTFDFQGYTNVFAESLPDPERIEVFQRYESFYRFLVRATDPDPLRRFATAEEMAEQLTGVLREVVALDTGRPRPALSTLFGAEPKVVGAQLLTAHNGDPSALGARDTAPRGGGLLRRRKPSAAEQPAAVLGQAAPPAPPAPRTPHGQPDHLGAEGRAPAYASVAGGGATTPGTTGGSPAPALGQGSVPRQATGESGALTGGRPDGAAPSLVAGPDPRLLPLDVVAAALALPVPRVDTSDANAGFLAGLMASAPEDLLTALEAAPGDSVERRLRELRARLELFRDGTASPSPGSPTIQQVVASRLRELEWWHTDDWRVIWYRALASLVFEDMETAAHSFEAVYDAFPGEPTPKLALGVCAEALGQLDNASEYYRLVWTTDPSFVSAAFGLARVRLAIQDREGAVRVLQSVPESSSHHTTARVASVRARLFRRSPTEPLLADLRAAAQQVERLGSDTLDSQRREELTTEVLGCALDWLLAGRHGEQQSGQGSGNREPNTLLGHPLTEEGLRRGLETSYRRLARLAQSGSERIQLVERANRFRPRTWV